VTRCRGVEHPTSQRCEARSRVGRARSDRAGPGRVHVGQPTLGGSALLDSRCCKDSGKRDDRLGDHPRGVGRCPPARGHGPAPHPVRRCRSRGRGGVARAPTGIVSVVARDPGRGPRPHDAHGSGRRSARRCPRDDGAGPGGARCRGRVGREGESHVQASWLRLQPSILRPRPHLQGRSGAAGRPSHHGFLTIRTASALGPHRSRRAEVGHRARARRGRPRPGRGGGASSANGSVTCGERLGIGEAGRLDRAGHGCRRSEAARSHGTRPRRRCRGHRRPTDAG